MTGGENPMETVTSRDGTEIAYYQRGTGPPLILVHGTVAANPIAWPACAGLTQRFTVYAMGRRGRRASGDGRTYALEREFGDVAAVVNTTGRPAYLLGHFFGALCALGAALLTPNLDKLVLYEPALELPGSQVYPDGLLERLEALLDAGDRERALVEHYSGVMSPAELERYRASPAWSERLAEVHTLPREMRADGGYVLDPQQFRELTVPTLLLVGETGPGFLRAATNAVHAALPDSRIVAMPGQGHMAMYSAPELFVREIVSFLEKAG
jgi:pimeloyl-ACP methyl ester carboxylesterase